MTAKSIERMEGFQKLPNDFQKAITASDYDNCLETITKKHKLHIDQAESLESLLAKILFGEVEPEDVISEIKSKVNLSKEEAVEIAKEINQTIVLPIKENLKSL